MKLKHSLYAFALVAVLPVAAQAQACIGLPLQTGQSAVAIGVGFPDNASSYGISATTKASDQLALSGSYTYASYDDEFGFTAGANALLTRYFAGAGISKVGDADAVFSIRIGLTF